MKLEDRISRSIAQRQGAVVLRSDFANMGSTAQVGRVLSRLIDKGKLIRVSKGAFAKTRINKFTGQPMPDGTLEDIGAELFRKLGIELMPSRLVAEYNSGRSTQVPPTNIANTGRRRISRKVTVGSRSVVYEKHLGRGQL
ncbi:DUF6088 family protein [Cupriavidus necator]|uniref:DUF6088 family protein n=1 Tax=Cupriavidus necator TaxID=106590 RepID=UPI00339D69FC